MSDKPILFNAEMVRAILEGRKTQTRRVVKPSPGLQTTWLTMENIHGFIQAGEMVKGGWQMWHPLGGPRSPYGWVRGPYGQPGDRLWVRETWASADCMYQTHENEEPSVVAYRANQEALQFTPRGPVRPPDYDMEQWNWDALKWRPSIYMPRWASRITLPLVSVRVERLQDISCADAMAEGISATANQFSIDCDTEDPRRMFVALWTSIHGPESWDANPWVWVLEWSKAEVRP